MHETPPSDLSTLAHDRQCDDRALMMSEQELRVNDWRLEQFAALGFDADATSALANSDADLHRARALIGAGCPRATAAAILL